MKKTIRSIAAAMALSLTLPVFIGSCASVKAVTTDSSWYEAKTVDLKIRYDASEYEMLTPYFVGMVKDKAVVRVDYSKPVPEDFDYGKDDISLYQGSSLEIYDTDGKFIKSIDCKDIKAQKDLQIGEFGPFTAASDSVILPFTSFNESGADNTIILSFDIDSGKVTDSYQDLSSDKHMGSYVFAEDYSVFSFMDLDSVEKLEIEIRDKNGDTRTVELSAPDIDWNGGLPLVDIGNGRVIAPYLSTKSGKWGDVGYFIVDLKNASAKQVTDDTSWFGGYDGLWNITGVKGLGTCSSDDDGLFKLDFDGKKAEQIINFDRCDANLYLLRRMKLYSASDGRYVFGGCVLEENYLNTAEPPKMIILQKSDKDLAQGKKVLTLASFNVVDYATAEAVLKFNRTNSEYRISFDTKYNLAKFYEENTQDDTSVLELKARKKLVDKLKVDILAGEGPDIIMNGINYTASLDQVLFADLTNDISSDGLFENITGACKTGGKLYSVPITFQLSGIFTDSKYVKDGQKGFTFDEYKTFVSQVCNGKDPIEMEKTDYFTYNFDLMYSRFLDSDGNPDFKESGFADLAKYVKENVNYVAPDGEACPVLTTIDDKTHAVYKTIGTVMEYAGSFDHKTYKTVVLGTPSVDGAGPAISVVYSAGVSASSKNKAGAVEFIKLLLSEEIQSVYAKNTFHMPVRVSSFEAASKEIISQYNVARKKYIDDGFAKQELIQLGYVSDIDAEAVENLKEVIKTADICYRTDPAVSLIVREEIQPYLQGQKSIEEVVDIVNNRTKLYLSERTK